MRVWISLEISDCSITYISKLPKEDGGMAANVCYPTKRHKEQLVGTASGKWALAWIQSGKCSKSAAVWKGIECTSKRLCLNISYKVTADFLRHTVGSISDTLPVHPPTRTCTRSLQQRTDDVGTPSLKAKLRATVWVQANFMQSSSH